MKLNYKSILSTIAIISTFLTSSIANNEASELKKVDKEEKALLNMFNKECDKAKCKDKNETKKSK